MLLIDEGFFLGCFPTKNIFIYFEHFSYLCKEIDFAGVNMLTFTVYEIIDLYGLFFDSILATTSDRQHYE